MSAVPPEGINYHEEVNNFVRERRALKIQINRLMVGLLILSLLSNASQGLANAILAKIHDIIPLLVAINSDGSHDVLTNANELAPKERLNVVKAAFLTYVRNCVGYQFEGAPHAYQICSQMSSKQREDEYQKWFASLEGPQAKYGEHASVFIQDIPDGIEFTSDQTATESFWRIVQQRGLVPQSPEHWTATFGFYVRGTVAEADIGFNPLGVTITSFDARCDGCEGEK